MTERDLDNTHEGIHMRGYGAGERKRGRSEEGERADVGRWEQMGAEGREGGVRGGFLINMLAAAGKEI